MSYTEQIDSWYFSRAGLTDSDFPKPEPELPEDLSWLISRLERERPRHWTLAAIALLCGDDDSRHEWSKFIRRVPERLNSVRWTNATQTFGDGLGVSIYVDFRTSHVKIRSVVLDYIKAKIDDLGVRNWIAIGEGGSGAMFVCLVETDSAPSLAEFFLNPSSVKTEVHTSGTNRREDDLSTP